MKTIQKDLLTCFEDGIEAFGHCSNCFQRFGRGVALAIKNKYPAAYQADLSHVGTPESRLGTFTTANVEGGAIYNIYGQFTWNKPGRNLNYEAFYTGLVAVRNDMQKKGLKTIAFPYLIGCDLAGGTWEIVHAMIQSELDDEEIDVTFYQLKSK